MDALLAFLKASSLEKKVNSISNSGQSGSSSSLSVSVTEITGGHRITITDNNGTESFDVMDGIDSAPPPSISITEITGGHRITVTDNNGTESFNVMDGIDSAPPPSEITKTGADQTFSIQDNCIYECGVLTSLTITSAPAKGNSMIVFTSGSTPTDVDFPATISFMEGSADVVNKELSPSANSRYEIIIRDCVAVVGKSEASA